jgi:hypothetical protein
MIEENFIFEMESLSNHSPNEDLEEYYNRRNELELFNYQNNFLDAGFNL